MLSDALQARPPERGATADAVRPAGESLQARVREIVAGSPTPEEALEPALRLILEGTGAAAGAICFYDQRAEVLRLAAESGLSDEGCRRLRTVRRGDTLSWDMPLQSLFNRRVYLIESASKNRYVPPLIEQAASVRTIACLPLYAGTTALGSLIAISVAPNAFTERHIKLLDLPVRELIRLIETVRQRPAPGPAAGPATRPAPAAPLPRAPDPQKVQEAQEALATAEALIAERELELATARVRIAELEAAAAATRERIAKLEADAVATREQLAKLVDEAKARARNVEAELAVRTEELEALRRERAAVETARLLAAEEELIRARERIAELEAEAAAVPERVSEGLQEAEARTRALAADLEARTIDLEAQTRELEARSTECATLRRALDAGTAEQQTAGAALDARDAELGSVAAQLEARTAEVASLGAALDERTAEIATLTAELQALRDERPAMADAAPPEEPATVVEVVSEPRLTIVPPASAEPPTEDEPTEATPIVLVDPSAPAAEPAHDGETLVIVDADATWEGIAVNGHRILVRRPGEAVAPGGGKLIANLATAGAIDGLVGLRGAGCDGKIWACVSDVGSGKALPLGPIEPAARPFDLDAVLASLTARLARGARVVTVGSDVDVLVSLRQALARQGISVSMAWDGKQADDLLAMVRPQLVVLDLALPQNEGYRILGRLAAAEHVPTALIVGGEDDAAGFAALLKDPMQAQRLVPLDRLVANVLARRDRAA